MLGASKGNEAQRILGGEKKREADKAAHEAAKAAIVEKNKVSTFNNKFGTSKGDVLHTEYQASTVGLVTLEQLKAKREELAKKEVILEHLNREAAIKAELEKKETDTKKRKTKVTKTSLSFAEDLDGEEGEEEVELVKKKRVVKDPNVNTSFLPDRERELQEIEKRKLLTEEWTKEQVEILSSQRPVKLTVGIDDSADGCEFSTGEEAGGKAGDHLLLLGRIRAQEIGKLHKGHKCGAVSGDCA